MTGDSVTWFSDREGDLGAGDRLLVPELGWGWHRITVTVTDSDENTVSETIRVYAGQQQFLPLLASPQGSGGVEQSAGAALIDWALAQLSRLTK